MIPRVNLPPGQAGVIRRGEDNCRKMSTVSDINHHTFFSFGPLGVSSIIQPLAFNSSRMASRAFEILRLARGLSGFEQGASISAGASVSAAAAMPRTELTRSQAASADAASADPSVFSARRRLVSRHPVEHGRPGRGDVQVLVQRRGEIAATSLTLSGCGLDSCRANSRSLPTHSSIRASAVRAPVQTVEGEVERLAVMRA